MRRCLTALEMVTIPLFVVAIAIVGLIMIAVMGLSYAILITLVFRDPEYRQSR